MRNQWLSAPDDLADLCLCILSIVNTSATDHCLRLVPIGLPLESVCMLKKPRNSCTQASILICNGHLIMLGCSSPGSTFVSRSRVSYGDALLTWPLR
jgi:hypothetical protein